MNEKSLISYRFKWSSNKNTFLLPLNIEQLESKVQREVMVKIVGRIKNHSGLTDFGCTFYLIMTIIFFICSMAGSYVLISIDNIIGKILIISAPFIIFILFLGYNMTKRKGLEAINYHLDKHIHEYESICEKNQMKVIYQFFGRGKSSVI